MTTPSPSPTAAPTVPALPSAAPSQPCPQCGANMAPVALGPESAPWLCVRCRLGFWSAELSAEARVGWQPQVRCFHWSVGRRLRPLVDAERAEAIVRGVSLRPDQVGLVGHAVLAEVAGRRGVDSSFAAQVQAAVAQRKVV